MGFEWDFAAVWQHSDMLFEGALGTLQLAVVSIFFGVIVGALLATARLSTHRGMSLPATCFVEFFRNTPPLVHFFWFFYALPIVAGISLSPFWAAALALSTQSGAFYAEVFRGGIKSIERGQWEGGRSIGLTSKTIMRRIILPQAFKRMAGPFMERTFELTKTTTLASTLAFGELLYQAMQVNAITYRPLEVYSTIALMFFFFLLVMSMCMKWVEYKITAN
ncbi:amino acid ABC transporter permease [Rhodanobacter aciditrophus]|uniref:Amino acid ABC transporter permease n=1 Tax=Rhodanobacter aciditrophus TaxID=1623218 RepID=A0ABW4B2F0_9GAMM